MPGSGIQDSIGIEGAPWAEKPWFADECLLRWAAGEGTCVHFGEHDDEFKGIWLDNGDLWLDVRSRVLSFNELGGVVLFSAGYRICIFSCCFLSSKREATATHNSSPPRCWSIVSCVGPGEFINTRIGSLVGRLAQYGSTLQSSKKEKYFLEPYRLGNHCGRNNSIYREFYQSDPP